MKRILSLFLALLLAFSLVACDGETPDDATPADTSTPPADDGTAPDTETTDPPTPEPEPPTLAMYTLEDDEAEILRMLLENTEEHISFDLSNVEGEVEVVYGTRIVNAARQSSLPEELRIGGAVTQTEKLVIYDEREFYPDASGEYVYVMFVVCGSSGEHGARLSMASCENDTLKLRIFTFGEDADFVPSFFAIKILKSSLNSTITKIELLVS